MTVVFAKFLRRRARKSAAVPGRVTRRPAQPVQAIRRLAAAAGIKAWSDNALRHSFGSYQLAAYGDEKKTAMLMGHRNPDILHQHYKALVTKADAERFWALRPATGAAEKIVPMAQA